MSEENRQTNDQQKYSQYPEGFERLLKDLKFSTEDEAVKRMLLNTTISSLLHY